MVNALYPATYHNKIADPDDLELYDNEEEQRKAVSRTRFGQVTSIAQLDSLVMKFQSDAEKGKARQEGKVFS